jgi:hypothetical protein
VIAARAPGGSVRGVDDLFTHHARRDPSGRPLAERMRPSDLTELVGQGHLLGPGPLRAAADGYTKGTDTMDVWYVQRVAISTQADRLTLY